MCVFYTVSRYHAYAHICRNEPKNLKITIYFTRLTRNWKNYHNGYGKMVVSPPPGFNEYGNELVTKIYKHLT